MSEQEFNQLVNEFESLTKILTNTHELRERVEMKLRPMMQELGYSKIEGEGFEIISAPRLSQPVQDTIRQLKQLTSDLELKQPSQLKVKYHKEKLS